MTELLVGGSAGPGKSSCLIALAAKAAQHPASRGLFLRTRYKDMIDIRDKMGALYPKVGAVWHDTDKRWVFPNGATLMLGYGETTKEVEQYLGQEYTDLSYDEIGLLREEKAWDMLLSRLRSTDKTIKLRARASANPGGVAHAWLKRRFVDATEHGTKILKRPDGTSLAFIPGTANDNPSLNAEYWDRLNRLPEPLRSWWRDGNWSAGLGLAFTMVPERHLIKPFAVPSYWTQFGSLDWGFAHPFCAGWFAVDEDAQYYLVQTIWGRGLRASEIAASILASFPLERFTTIYAGHDLAQQTTARTEGQTPTMKETMAAAGVYTSPANIARVHGANLLREFLHFDEEHEPRLRIMDTAANRLVFQQLESAVTDPDHPEDVLKINADAHSPLGESGDDGYDMCRMGIASRTGAAKAPQAPSKGAFDRANLAVEARAQRLIGPDEMPPTLYTGF